MGPIGSGTKGTHNHHVIVILTTRGDNCKYRSGFLYIGCQFKKGQSAKAICMRGLSKIEVKTQIREATIYKAQGGLPCSFHGYHEVSTTK